MLPNGLAYLCGRTINYLPALAGGEVYLRNGGHVRVDVDDPGFKFLQADKFCFLVLLKGRIWAIYRRPKIKLLQLLASENPTITDEILELHQPVYHWKSARVF